MVLLCPSHVPRGGSPLAHSAWPGPGDHLALALLTGHCPLQVKPTAVPTLPAPGFDTPAHGGLVPACSATVHQLWLRQPSRPLSGLFLQWGLMTAVGPLLPPEGRLPLDCSLHLCIYSSTLV